MLFPIKNPAVGSWANTCCRLVTAKSSACPRASPAVNSFSAQEDSQTHCARAVSDTHLLW